MKRAIDTKCINRQLLPCVVDLITSNAIMNDIPPRIILGYNYPVPRLMYLHHSNLLRVGREQVHTLFH